MTDDDFSPTENKMLRPKRTTRTSAGLRDMLFDELDRLRNGHTTTHQALSVAKMATAILNTVKAEISFQKFVDSKDASSPSSSPIPPPIQLGEREIKE